MLGGQSEPSPLRNTRWCVRTILVMLGGRSELHELSLALTGVVTAKLNIQSP